MYPRISPLLLHDFLDGIAVTLVVLAQGFQRFKPRRIPVICRLILFVGLIELTDLILQRVDLAFLFGGLLAQFGDTIPNLL
jgi:hypothetical protein